MKKILFVTHDVSDYGAARSLQEVLISDNEHENHLHVILPLQGSKPKAIDLSKKFNIPEQNISFSFGYNSDEYLGGPVGFTRRTKQFAKKVIFNLFQRESFYRFLKKNHFTTVYLNSLTLYPYITNTLKDTSFIIHIRERLLSSNPENVKRFLKKASKIIYIDSATKEALQPFDHPTSIILTDPVNMSNVHTRNNRENCLSIHNEDLSECTVFSMIGKLDFVDKGTGFVLENFVKNNDPNIRLFIFGDQLPWTNDLEKARSIAGDDKRIIFMGEQSNISIIYGLTDVVVRAEKKFAIGRTVLEGLRSGCAIILPGEEDDLKNDALKFATDKVKIYEGRNSQGFLKAIESLKGFKKDNVPETFSNTVPEYNRSFFDFILS